MTQAVGDRTTVNNVVTLRRRIAPRPLTTVDAEHWAAVVAACRALIAAECEGKAGG
jgi:hypothetical protein